MKHSIQVLTSVVGVNGPRLPDVTESALGAVEMLYDGGSRVDFRVSYLAWRSLSVVSDGRVESVRLQVQRTAYVRFLRHDNVILVHGRSRAWPTLSAVLWPNLSTRPHITAPTWSLRPVIEGASTDTPLRLLNVRLQDVVVDSMLASTIVFGHIDASRLIPLLARTHAQVRSFEVVVESRPPCRVTLHADGRCRLVLDDSPLDALARFEAIARELGYFPRREP